MLSRRESLGGVLALASSAPLSAAATAPARWRKVDALAQGLIANRAVPAISVCVRRGGATLFEQGYGMANLETNSPMRADSVCRIGSITKQFTAAAILLLAEDGKLRLDDKLARFFPDVPRAADVSLERMLNHTAGLTDYTDRPPAEFFRMMRDDRDSTQMLAMLRELPKPLQFEPGMSWAYSSTGYALLGLIIERVTDQSYGQFMRARLFEPLGLHATAADSTADVVPGRADGYKHRADGGFDHADYISMSFAGGAGCLRSTAGDLCRWHEGLLGGRLLKPASLKAMMTPARLADGSFPKDARLGPAKQPIRYGFGVSLQEPSGRAAVLHSGNIPGYLSELRTYPDLGQTQAVIVTAAADRQSGPAMEAIQKALSEA